MVHPRRALCAHIAVLVLTAPALLAPLGTAFGAQKVGDDKKPSLSLRANPPVGFSPLRVRVVVDVRGGPDDYADFYCPSLQWDWGDGTISESSEDCEPYHEGKSAIRRRFNAEHVYRQSGPFRVTFRLKQREKAIAIASANVQVRTGVREEFGR